MLKQKDIQISKNISFHFGEESMWYVIPTIGFQRIDWVDIGWNKTTQLFVIKWLKYSIGIIKTFR